MDLTRGNMYKVNPRGSSIVEVLVCVAIVSLVLVGAFTVSQESEKSVRGGQEQGEVSQLLLAQVEQVRAKAITATSYNDDIYGPGEFCIDAASAPTLPAERVEVGNTACNDIDNLYDIAVKFNTTTKTFEFTGSWPGLGGDISSQKLFYRFPPGNEPFAAAASPAIPTGDAAIGPLPCNIDPATNGCIIPGVPQYRWRMYFTNQSNNPPASVSSCVWDFGDGQQATDKCNYLDQQAHTYAAQSPLLLMPGSCFAWNRIVTLTVTLTNGAVKTSAPFNRSIPQCY